MTLKKSKSSHHAAREMIATLQNQYQRPQIDSDPIYFVHQYRHPKDQEVAAFISSLFAFGQVKSIHGSLKKIFSLMGSSPYQFLCELKMPQEMQQIVHRWVRGEDVVHLLEWMHEMIQSSGSLKKFFLTEFKNEESDVTGLLTRVTTKIKESVPQKYLTRGFSYFFPSPKDGSPCKRMNMFLRWMVRSPEDGIDLGLWPEIGTSKLIIPLDTHVLKFAQKYRLSRRHNPSWVMAQEVTDFLKTLDPQDPVRFDFPICHYGMEHGW